MKARSNHPHPATHMLLALSMAAALYLSNALPANAAHDPHASMAASLVPNRLHAKVGLNIAIDYPDGESGIPEPVRRAVVRLPAGLTLDIPHLSSCSIARLRRLGPHACPVQSQLGRGHALLESHIASETIKESVSIWAFLGVPHNLQPTFVIVGRGNFPVYQEMIFSGTVLPSRPPFGEELVISIPALRTIAGATDASIARLTITIGTSGKARKQSRNSLISPTSCPTGGFPFAATFTYADGTTDSAEATDRCPQ